MDAQNTIPDRLLPYKHKFEHWRKGNGRCKCTEAYEQIYPLILDTKLTFEDIGRLCGGRSKQWVSDMLERYYPGVRPKKNGRYRSPSRQNDPETRKKKRRERRRKAREEFEATCINYRLLKKHAAAAKFRLGIVWKKDHPRYRVFRIKGHKSLVVRICSAANLNENGVYVHCISPVAASLKDVKYLVVLVEIGSSTLKVSRLYRISVKKFNATGLTNILIRLSKRARNGGGAKAAIQWNRRHLISNLK